MTEPRQYLYCIIRCAGECAFHGVTPIGDGEGPVRTVLNDGLAAVVSASSISNYDTTRANMMAHERVLERVMQQFTLLPVRFGTVADSPSPIRDIRKLLERRHQEFHQLLADMEGKVELGLKALWRDEKALFEEILAENPRLRSFRDSLVGKPPQATHFDRIRLGELIKNAMDRKRAAEAATVLAPLRRVAHRTVENPIVVDRMMANAAFLVAKEHEEAFDQAVSKLDKELEHRVLLKYAGPVPPYNFVSVVVNWREL